MEDLNITTVTTLIMTTAASGGDKDSTWGYVAAFIAVLLFGSNFVPIKKFETGDGMFFQWVVCSAIFLIGLCVNAIQHFPKFYPLAMLGGFLWATGNVCVVPIVKTIGLSKGLLIWGTMNLLSGWASGRFGWFGIKPNPPNNEVLNYAGVGLAVISVFVYIFVKSDVSSRVDDVTVTIQANETDPLIPEVAPADEEPRLLLGHKKTGGLLPGDESESFIDRLSPKKKIILGTVLSVISGIFYGLTFTPVIYIQNNYPHASQNGLDYVFAHFSGVYATSCVYFLIYCGYKQNRPSIYPKCILPGYVCGGMWAIASAAWFVANDKLSEPVSFPIITTGPGVIAALWGVLVFKEIRGKRNLLLLLIAFSITISGVVLTALSKL